MKKYQKDFLIHLLESGGIRFGKFKLKSGRVSPYFINMSKAVSTGSGASKTAIAYAKEIYNEVGVDFDYIHGPAYKGIPLSALTACKLWDLYKINKRWGYDRKEEKRYGDESEKIVVGDVREGDRVLIEDDVITTGQTKLDNWNKLRFQKDKLKAIGILVAVDRQEVDENGEVTTEVLREKGLPVFSILKIKDIFNYLINKKINNKVFVDKKIKEDFDKYFEKYGAL